MSCSYFRLECFDTTLWPFTKDFVIATYSISFEAQFIMLASYYVVQAKLDYWSTGFEGLFIIPSSHIFNKPWTPYTSIRMLMEPSTKPPLHSLPSLFWANTSFSLYLSRGCWQTVHFMLVSLEHQCSSLSFYAYIRARTPIIKPKATPIIAHIHSSWSSLSNFIDISM